MSSAAIVVDPEKITYGNLLKRFRVSRTEDIALQLRVISDELIRAGASNIRMLMPGHERQIEYLDTHFPQCAFSIHRFIDVIGPLVHSRQPLWRMGEFQDRWSFGVASCSLRGDIMQLFAYQATRDGSTSNWTYLYKNDLTEARDRNRAGFMLGMAESLYVSGLTDIAIFIPEVSEMWLVLAQQVADRLPVNVAVFVAPDVFEELVSL